MLLSALVTGCPVEPGEEGPPVGRIIGTAGFGQVIGQDEPAPEFLFESPEGMETLLGELAGEVVFLYFWSVDCPVCIDEMPLIQEAHDRWADRGLVILAIAIGDSPADVKEFLASQGYTLPVLLDGDAEAAFLYRAFFTPTSFLIGRDGTIQDRKVGPFSGWQELEAWIRQLIPG